MPEQDDGSLEAGIVGACECLEINLCPLHEHKCSKVLNYLIRPLFFLFLFFAYFFLLFSFARP